MREGVDGLLRDKTRPPGKPRTSEAKVREVADLARSSAPEGETHWTVRALAEKVSLSPSTVHEILVRHRLAPHKDKRNGTTTLFAATDILDATVIGSHSDRHRRQEFIAFLDRIDKAAPAGRKIHAIVDNYSAHKHSAVTEWLADRRRWTLHFTPTSCSWTDAVEGFFGKPANRRLRSGGSPHAKEGIK